MSSFDDWIGQNVPDAIMEDAASWMALLDSESCRATDRVAFATWLAADPMHQWAFEELSQVWAKLRSLQDVNALADHKDVIRFPERREAPDRQPAPASQNSRSERSTFAAVLVVVVGVVIHILTGTPADSYSTQTGEIQNIELEDGSRIELNSRSGVEIRLDDDRREVRLEDGEAVFHVHKDSRPFIVKTGLADIAAVGTAFAVHADASVVSVAVIEGLVSVSSNGLGTSLTEYDGDLMVRFSDEIAMLGAGQRLELTRENRRFETVTEDQMNDELSWRNGEMVFENTPLVSALSKMRRHVGSRIYIGDPVLNGLRVSGRFSTDSAEHFLQILQSEYGVVTETVGQQMTILRVADDPVGENPATD